MSRFNGVILKKIIMKKPKQKVFKLFVIGKRRVKIIQRFNHSILVEYYDTKKQASVNPELIKTILKQYEVKTDTQQKLDI